MTLGNVEIVRLHLEARRSGALMSEAGATAFTRDGGLIAAVLVIVDREGVLTSLGLAAGSG